MCSPDRDFAPVEQPVFIQQIDPIRGLGIVAAPDGIAAQILQDADFLHHQLGREGEAPFGMLLVAVYTLEADFLAVQINVAFRRPDEPEADAVRQIIVRCGGPEQIKLRLAYVPQAGVRKGMGERQGCRAVSRHLSRKLAD
ncbi:hypothetical protein D3C75_979420 [compost metagenome]